MYQNKFIDVTLALDNEKFIFTHKDASCIYIRAHNNKEDMQWLTDPLWPDYSKNTFVINLFLQSFIH